MVGSKYTNWVPDGGFSTGQLKALLWAVGEYKASAHALLKFLRQHPADLKGAERAVFALEALFYIACGERFAADEWARRIYRSIRLLPADLPDAVTATLKAAAPGATWGFIFMIPGGYEIGGKDAAGQPLHAYVSSQGTLNHLGPERRPGKPLAASAITAELAEDLGRSECTAWATDREMSEEHLYCLFVLFGEFAARYVGVLMLLDQHRVELAEHRRAVVALEALVRLVQGEWLDADELVRRIERGRAQLQFEDLPQNLRPALQQAAPKVRWNGVWMKPDGYLLSGFGPEGENFAADILHAGAVTLRTYLDENELPAPIIAKVKTRAPGIRIEAACSVGPALGTVHGYEVDVELELYGHRRMKLVYDAAGREIRA